MYVTVNRLLSLAGRLLDSRHFASSSIRQVALLLEKGWKEFASLLDLRTQVLGLSVTFHQKAEQVMQKRNLRVISTLLLNNNLLFSTSAAFRFGRRSVMMRHPTPLVRLIRMRAF
jgi:hypothetical protein